MFHLLIITMSSSSIIKDSTCNMKVIKDDTTKTSVVGSMMIVTMLLRTPECWGKRIVEDILQWS